MPDRSELEALFVEHLSAIERIVAALCRRHGLTGDSAADFGSWVKLRLVENDYAVLAKFRGESSLTTYLTVVMAMLFRDYCVERWGRWRPSAAAQRRGPLAVRLETLVRRDRYPLDQAAQLLRTSGETTLSDRELAKLLGDLPDRGPLRPTEVGPEPLADLPTGMRADEAVDREQADADRRAADEALRRGLARLSAEDQLIVRMRFWEGLSIADVARGLGLPQKPLYRRIEHALAELRRHLEAAGVSRERARVILGESVEPVA
jgi:RNA polymerase sigma factor (sigma-70 family)